MNTRKDEEEFREFADHSGLAAEYFYFDFADI
jgi:hypothetical protein